MPTRIQLSRKKGFRLPPDTVNVARPGKWGNPFKVTESRTQAMAVAAFEIWLKGSFSAGIPERKKWMQEHLEEIRGKNLACWCKPGKPCHADVLMEIANAGESK